MNSALLLGQLGLLVALVPTIYLANFYYKAYHAERTKAMNVNGVLVLDKYFFVTELMELEEKLKATAAKSDLTLTRDLLTICATKLHLVLDGNKRRLAEAKRQVL